MKNIIVLTLTGGLVVLLLIIVIGDFYVALQENRPVDDNVIQLLQMSVTGILGLVAGFVSSKPPKV
tara:strand:- start:556 stop:753 length:198 start_codon:yes stop_codon:yes gene_type:complete